MQHEDSKLFLKNKHFLKYFLDREYSPILPLLCPYLFLWVFRWDLRFSVKLIKYLIKYLIK